MEEITRHDQPRTDAEARQEQDTKRMAEVVEAFAEAGRWAVARANRQRPATRGGRLR